MDLDLETVGQVIGAPIVPTVVNAQRRFPGIKPITVSNFKPNDDNIIFSKDFVTFGLKQGENLLIKGQYSVRVQRGCLRIGTVLYHASPKNIQIIAPTFSAIPVLCADQVIDRSLVEDDKTPINEHLFSAAYKTVLQIKDHSTGLEDIGKIYPPLKNVLPAPGLDPNDEEQAVVHEFELPFAEFTFQPVFQDDGLQSSVSGLVIPKSWLKPIDSIRGDIEDLSKDIQARGGQARILVVGSKNSGKSTFLRTLLNDVLYKNDYCVPVNVMDLDPGQPEFSLPDSVSISEVNEDVWGFNCAPFTKDASRMVLRQEYVGVSNPNRLAPRYQQACLDLCDQYEEELVGLNQPLIINTAGWIKGYGIEVLKAVSAKLKPTHLVFLGPQNSNSDFESEFFSSLTYEKLVQVTGYLNSLGARYSAAQLRNFKTLAYFHFTGYQQPKASRSVAFDFTPLILSHSPYQVSYNAGTAPVFEGIAAFVFLASQSKLRPQDVVHACEASVMAIYSVKLAVYLDMLANGQVSVADDYPNTAENVLVENATFHGLVLVHSIDVSNRTCALYTPVDTSKLSDGSDSVLVLARGSTEIPIEEIAPKQFYKTCQQQGIHELPYITFNRHVGKGGKVLKVRRNIMRRSHQA